MFKTALLFVVLCTLLNYLVPATEAYDHHEDDQKVDVQHNLRGETSSPKEEFRYNEKYGKYEKYENNEKYRKKKYYKDDGYSKEYAFKKNKGHDKKRFVNSNEFDHSPKNGKYDKYDKRPNHYEAPFRNKEINYHDKVRSQEKDKFHSEQEIIEEPTLISLHHDIDVNFIGNHDTVTKDAEFINLESPMQNYKKKDYIKNVNDVIENKVKTNFYKNLKEIDLISIPPSNNSALIARYIIHNVDWTAIATLSTNSKMRGSPFVNVISVSDGTLNKGSGVPFFYMTPKDFSSIDLEKDNRCTITATLAQTDFCRQKKLDPENPLCARLILNGKIKKVKINSEEEKFAAEALFSRHPEMKAWPADHDWFFAKLKIKQIILINHFGGASYVSIQDYFDAENA